jgi:hypothetical protein
LIFLSSHLLFEHYYTFQKSCCSGQSKADDATCTSLVGGYNTTVLMVADPGDFTGSAEAKYYNENLEVN